MFEAAAAACQPGLGRHQAIPTGLVGYVATVRFLCMPLHKNSGRIALLAAMALAAITACERAPRDQTVTVYSSRSHYGAESVFVAFTRATGIKVEFFEGNNNEVLERLKSEGERTSADMLLTANAGYLAEITGGRDKKKELSEAVDEVIATGRTDGPAVKRVCGEE